MPKPCLECGCITGGNSYCDSCRNQRDQAKNARKGRRPSQGWLKTRKRVLQRDGYRCRATGCERTNNLHIHRLDGGYHDNNIDAYVTLCVEHHRVAEQHTDRDRNDQQEAEPSFLVF